MRAGPKDQYTGLFKPLWLRYPVIKISAAWLPTSTEHFVEL